MIENGSESDSDQSDHGMRVCSGPARLPHDEFSVFVLGAFLSDNKQVIEVDVCVRRGEFQEKIGKKRAGTHMSRMLLTRPQLQNRFPRLRSGDGTEGPSDQTCQ